MLSNREIKEEREIYFDEEINQAFGESSIFSAFCINSKIILFFFFNISRHS